MVRDDVEYLFDVMSEIYHKAPEEKADLPEHTTAPPPEHEEEEKAAYEAANLEALQLRADRANAALTASVKVVEEYNRKQGNAS